MRSNSSGPRSTPLVSSHLHQFVAGDFVDNFFYFYLLFKRFNHIFGVICSASLLLLVATEFSQFSVAERQRRPEVVDHFAHHLVARTVLVDVVAPQIAHQLDLLVRDLYRLLEHHPDHRLGERRRGQRPEVSPEAFLIRQQLHRIAGTVRERNLYGHNERMLVDFKTSSTAMIYSPDRLCAL